MSGDNGTRDSTIAIKIGISLRDADRLIIEGTLRHTGGNVSRAANVVRVATGSVRSGDVR